MHRVREHACALHGVDRAACEVLFCCFLQEEFDVERTEIVNTHVRQRKDMTDMLAAMEQEFADAENELRQVRALARTQVLHVALHMLP